jgi:TPR repeat protein
MEYSTIEDITKQHKITFNDNVSDNDILSIFNGQYVVTEDTLNNSKLLNLLGLYYQHIVKDYEKMEKYLLMAIDQKDSNAMCNYGHYYQHIVEDYVNMEKYYLMAIELGNSSAMNNLGHYFHHTVKDYENMEK